ncbi:hypothetical protein AB0I35_22895 [Nocardia sp. NPDC050378]|uniref:hypothetical protein n=1 Tax=Nocardia sp. NPDC050378 TaxID=3155400 RepID=UPI0033EF8D38
MSDATSALLAELGGRPSDIVEQLTADEAATVLNLYLTARRQRRVELDRAIDDTLGFLPRLVRIPARKIMFGK